MSVLLDDVDGKFKVTLEAKVLDTQVAGHRYGKNGKKLGMLDRGNGIVMKALQTPPRGKRELDMYQNTFAPNCQNKDLLELRNFLPLYFGTEIIDDVTFLVMGNLAHRFAKPNILDIKMGRVTYDPEANEAKRSHEISKYPPLKDLGFQLTGMMMHDPVSGEPYHFSKAFCRSIEADTMLTEGLGRFFGLKAGRLRKDVISAALERLRRIDSWFQVQRTYAFYASSLLLIYSSLTPESPPASASNTSSVDESDPACAEVPLSKEAPSAKRYSGKDSPAGGKVSHRKAKPSSAKCFTGNTQDSPSSGKILHRKVKPSSAKQYTGNSKGRKVAHHKTKRSSVKGDTGSIEDGPASEKVAQSEEKPSIDSSAKYYSGDNEDGLACEEDAQSQENPSTAFSEQYYSDNNEDGPACEEVAQSPENRFTPSSENPFTGNEGGSVCEELAESQVKLSIISSTEHYTCNSKEGPACEEVAESKENTATFSSAKSDAEKRVESELHPSEAVQKCSEKRDESRANPSKAVQDRSEKLVKKSVMSEGDSLMGSEVDDVINFNFSPPPDGSSSQKRASYSDLAKERVQLSPTSKQSKLEGRRGVGLMGEGALPVGSHFLSFNNSPLVEVRMIDFAHVFPDNGRDDNYLFGLHKLIQSLEKLLEI